MPRMHWTKENQAKLNEFIDNNATVKEAQEHWGVTYSTIAIRARRQRAYVRKERLCWKPDAVAPKVAAKVPEVNKAADAMLLDRVRNVLDEIEYLKFCGVVFDCRNGEVIALMEVKA